MTLLDSIPSVQSPASSTAAPLCAGDAIAPDDVAAIRRRMCLEYCKWDPQVGDVATLAAFPLILRHAAWRELADAAGALAGETLALERALIRHPDLHARLGLPRRLRQVLPGDESTLTPAAARVMRFDFHLTADDGWQISEVNSDVPGGFTEASAFPRLMAQCCTGASAAGDPATGYIDAILEQSPSPDYGSIVLLSAAGFMEDHQIVANLARLLRERGAIAHLAQPQQLHWRDGCAEFAGTPVAAIVRFYQGEWLARLPRRVGWERLFAGGKTLVANPGVAILTESKRLPLLWDELGVNLRAWPRYLPETRDPRDCPWRRDDAWLIKAAYANTGDAVFDHSSATLKTRLDVLLHPCQWVAQRRFDALPIDTPLGPRFACVGVYVIDGHACGIYGRLARERIVCYDATDVAVLIEDADDAEGGEE